MTMNNQSLVFCWTYSNNCQQVNAHWGVYKVILLQRLTPLIINEESKSTLTAFSIIIPQCLFCFVYGWSPTCSQLCNCLLSQTRHKIKERGKSRSWRTEKNRKFRNNIFRDSSYYTIFRVRTKYFFSKFKIDKYEFITKIGKIEKVKKKKNSLIFTSIFLNVILPNHMVGGVTHWWIYFLCVNQIFDLRSKLLAVDEL